MSIFKRLVADMRDAQKEYFATPKTHYTKKKEVLVRSKRLEKLVDQHIVLMQDDLPFKNPLQLSIDE